MTHEAASQVIDTLFEDWYPFLVRYLYRITGNRSSAEDVAQETYLDLYRALRKNEDVRHAKAWTLTVGRRKAHQLRETPTEPLEDYSSMINVVPDINAQIDGESMRGLFGVLTAREEEVLLLRLEALKYREIADRLEISVASVNTMLARAIEKLRKAAGVLGKEARGNARRS